MKTDVCNTCDVTALDTQTVKICDPSYHRYLRNDTSHLTDAPGGHFWNPIGPKFGVDIVKA